MEITASAQAALLAQRFQRFAALVVRLRSRVSLLQRNATVVVRLCKSIQGLLDDSSYVALGLPPAKDPAEAFKVDVIDRDLARVGLR